MPSGQMSEGAPDPDGKFPKGRTHRRAWHRTNAVLTGRAWVAVVSALLAAAGAAYVTANSTRSESTSPPPQIPWAHVFLAAFVAGAATVAAYALVGLAVYLFHRWTFRRAGYGHQDWETRARLRMDAVSGFFLWPKEDGMPVSPSDHGIVECRFRTPSGHHELVPNRRVQRRAMSNYFGAPDRLLLTTINQEVAEEGVYEVRWYGSTSAKRRFHEIARGRFDMRMGEEWAQALPLTRRSRKLAERAAPVSPDHEPKPLSGPMVDRSHPLPHQTQEPE